MNSIKEIALKAKVSTGTVDRVIHNRPGVSEKTKQKILEIIKESNYTVNPVASILASKKSYTIASLLPLSNHENDFWEIPKKGISQAITEIKSLGFKYNSFNFDQFNSESYIKAFEKMVACQPNAVLITPIFRNETQQLVVQLETLNIPYVFVNTETEGLNNLSFIGQSSHKGGFLAAKLLNWVLPENSDILIAEIRKDIANYTSINNRVKGFKSFFEQSKKTINIKTLKIHQIENQELLNKQILSFLDEHKNIKGIFIPSSKASLIAKSLTDLNRTDIEIGGFDTTLENITYLKNDTIDFLISQKAHQQGYDGIKLLFNYLIHKKTPAKNYFMPIEIVLKENVDFL